MSALLITTIASGAGVVVLAVLFAIEGRRGRRFGADIREQFDRAVASTRSFITDKAAIVNRLFFRELLHYVTHHILALFLATVRAVERTTVRVARVNRRKAEALRRAAYAEPSSETAEAASPHLSAIADHKHAVALSEAEKHKRKKQALRTGL